MIDVVVVDALCEWLRGEFKDLTFGKPLFTSYDSSYTISISRREKKFGALFLERSDLVRGISFVSFIRFEGELADPGCCGELVAWIAELTRLSNEEIERDDEVRLAALTEQFENGDE